MQTVLKQIKTELKEIKQKNNLKLKHRKNQYQEALDYFVYFSINRKKHYLQMSFILQNKEESLSFIYRYVCTLKNLNIDESNSFSDLNKVSLPGITKASREQLKSIYKFEVIDDQIKNTVAIDEQVKVVLEVFKKSYEKIIELASKKNIIPE